MFSVNAKLTCASRPQKCVVRYFFRIGLFVTLLFDAPTTLQVMPDDHSKLVPPLPIPNRTVKRLRADDSAATSVKVGYRQATLPRTPDQIWPGVFYFAQENKSPRYR